MSSAEPDEMELAGGQGVMRPAMPEPPPQYLTIALVRYGNPPEVPDWHVVLWATDEELDVLITEIKVHGLQAEWERVTPIRPDEFRSSSWIFKD